MKLIWGLTVPSSPLPPDSCLYWLLLPREGRHSRVFEENPPGSTGSLMKASKLLIPASLHSRIWIQSDLGSPWFDVDSLFLPLLLVQVFFGSWRKLQKCECLESVFELDAVDLHSKVKSVCWMLLLGQNSQLWRCCGVPVQNVRAL